MNIILNKIFYTIVYLVSYIWLFAIVHFYAENKESECATVKNDHINVHIWVIALFISRLIILCINNITVLLGTPSEQEEEEILHKWDTFYKWVIIIDSLFIIILWFLVAFLATNSVCSNEHNSLALIININMWITWWWFIPNYLSYNIVVNRTNNYNLLLYI